MRIENWSIIFDGKSDPYQAPELRHSCVMGKVYNHREFKDGHNIITSTIDKVEKGCIITQSGSNYELGEINPKYLETYPNALDVLK